MQSDWLHRGHLTISTDGTNWSINLVLVFVKLMKYINIFGDRSNFGLCKDNWRTLSLSMLIKM